MLENLWSLRTKLLNFWFKLFLKPFREEFRWHPFTFWASKPKNGLFWSQGLGTGLGFGSAKFDYSKFYFIKYWFQVDLVHLVVIFVGPLITIISLERSSFQCAHQFRSLCQVVLPVIFELCFSQGASLQRQLVSLNRHKCASPQAPRRTTNCWPEWSRGSSQVSPPSRLTWRAWTVESKLSPARSRDSECALGKCDLDV